MVGGHTLARGKSRRAGENSNDMGNWYTAFEAAKQPLCYK